MWGIRLLRLFLVLALGAGALVGVPALVASAGAAVQPCTVTYSSPGGTIQPDTADAPGDPVDKHGSARSTSRSPTPAS